MNDPKSILPGIDQNPDDGQPSARLLAVWPREEQPPVKRGGRIAHETWCEPGGAFSFARDTEEKIIQFRTR